MKYIEKYLKDIIKVKPLGKLTTEEDELDGISGEMVYIDGKCSNIFISHIDYANWLEKQGEQNINVQISPSEYVNDMGGNGCYLKNTTQTSTWNKKEEKVDNQKCVKSVYDVEPKFKVGDWICNDMCDAHIASIENGMYYFDEGDGLSIVFVDEHYHLWTIEDAMDGDVLATDKSVFIYAKVLYNKPYAYCGVDKFGVFKDNCLKYDWANSVDNIHPATKEQRDLLFQKMKEAGYTFDFKNKELKKIKNDIEIPFGAKDSELQEATYFIPKGFHAEIDDDFVIIKKGEPTTWNKEDEELVKWSINNLTELKDRFGEEYGKVGKCIDWLKSLKQRIGG